jgi:alpha-tubulin suppressor-like RCC1 family protein
MSSNTFSSKSPSWFKTKVLTFFGLFLFSLVLVGCGSSGGGGSSSPKSSNNTMTGFTFNNSVIHIASIDQDARKVDITINELLPKPKPIVTHTGVDYFPKEPIEFDTMPKYYTIIAENDSNKTYQVIVRRAIQIGDELTLSAEIDRITKDNLTYITLLISRDMNLNGINKIVIPSDWKERNIILEKDNSSVSNVTIKGLAIEGNDTVRLIDVNIHIAKVASIAAGEQHSLVLDSDGGLWASGRNTFGQLGLGNNASQNSFQEVTSLSNKTITKIAASDAQSFAIDSDGKLWASGYNKYAQLGLGNNVNQNSFQQVISLSNKTITKISAGGSHSLALDSDGGLWASGSNNVGQLGLGDYNNQTLFQLVTISGLAPTAKIVSISAGFLHSIVLDSEGGLWASGNSFQGVLGFDDTSNRSSFERVTFYASSTVPMKAIGSRYLHSLALDINGSVWATGYDSSGQLGGANAIGIPIQEYFDKAPELSGIAKIEAGEQHSLALDGQGKIWVSGLNKHGQLGLGDNNNTYSFQSVTISDLASSTKITSIVAGNYHSFAIDSEGKLWASGYNEDGQLGLGDNENRKVFTLVPSPWL